MKLRPIKKMNKKAQFESVLIAIITLFIIAALLFFITKFTATFYESFEGYFNDSKYNNTLAHQTTSELLEIETSNMWDYAFLAIFIGLVIQIILFSFATRINIAFFWLMVIVDFPILIVGVVLSNIWQELASDPNFADTIVRFPITDSLLGTYYPIAIMFVMFISSIILFGKRPGE